MFVICNLKFVVLLLFINFATCGCQQPPLYRSTQVMMGTFIEVSSPDSRAANIVFSEIQRIENLLSKYKPESEVSRLNKTGELAVSPETFFIIKRSLDFWQASGGAFDISVGPLIDLWGFTDKRYRLPTEEDIKLALTLVGSDKIILNFSNNVVKFMFPGIKIDLGAIAKGYAVDCAIKKVKEAAISSCLVNAGGQVYGLGNKSGRPWKIAMRDPRKKFYQGPFDLYNKAVATSGDYEQFFIKDNKRFSHIMDPRTGYPADSGVISATVIAEDGLTADALATAIVVLGEEKSREMLKLFPGVQTKIIQR